jgi:hypothetical protein
VNFFGFVLQLYSYLFHLALSAFLVGLAAIAWTNHQPLRLDMLPVASENAVSRAALLGLLGLFCTLLALLEVSRFLYPLWAALVLYLLCKGLFFNPYNDAGLGSKVEFWLTLAVTGAFVGALWVLKPRHSRSYL